MCRCVVIGIHHNQHKMNVMVLLDPRSKRLHAMFEGTARVRGALPVLTLPVLTSPTFAAPTLAVLTINKMIASGVKRVFPERCLNAVI